MSSHFHELISWIEITRFGMPQFTVARRPIVTQGVELKVGELFPVESVPNLSRLRQLYEQRAIAVVADTVVRPSHLPLRRLAHQVAGEVPSAPGVERVDRIKRAEAAAAVALKNSPIAPVAPVVPAMKLNLPGVSAPVGMPSKVRR